MRKFNVTNEVLQNNNITEENARDYFLKLIEDGFFIEIEPNVEISVSNILTSIEEELIENEHNVRYSNGKLIKKRQGIRKTKLNKHNKYSHLDDNDIVKDNHGYKKMKKNKYTGEIDKQTVESLNKNYYIKNKRSA